jgi:hypothetical protein
MTETGNSSGGTTPLDWTKLDALSDAQLSALVDAAIFVLGEGGDVDAAAARQMPARPLAKELAASLGQRGLDSAAAERIVGEGQMSRPIAILLLQQLASEPEIAAEIERTWRQRGGMLFVGTASILAAALLLLVVKVKKFKADKSGVTVDFDKVSTGALGAVFKFVGL